MTVHASCVPDLSSLGRDVALDPVISLRSGRVIGYQAVAGPPPGGREEDDLLLREAIEAAVWSTAIALFAAVSAGRDQRLFLGLDFGLVVRWPDMAARLAMLLDAHGVDRRAITLSLSERRPILDLGGGFGGRSLDRVAGAVVQMRGAVGSIALDGFGGGHAGLALLAAVKPDYVVLDPYFVSTQAIDQTRRLFLGHLVDVAHLLGAQVIAPQVEHLADYHACRDAGCDLVRGPVLAKPERDPRRLPEVYPQVAALNAGSQRRGRGDQHLVAAQMDDIDPLMISTKMADVFERFRRQKDRTFFPVVDERGEPLGIVREVDLKEYTYSLYGKDLIGNKALGRTLSAFLTRCPRVDIDTRAEKILEAFSTTANGDGLIITQDGRYRGFLTAASLLRVINDKNLEVARDQNPLTRLPGNTVINTELGEILADDRRGASLVYLDFDHFKPFNDKYGFRQGDRAILLFADLLRSQLAEAGFFIGHVGGDDFFAALREGAPAAVTARIRALIDKFAADVTAFYDDETRQAGYVLARDRDGHERRLPLLSVSAALVHLAPGHAIGDLDRIGGVIARLKKAAKQSPCHLAETVAGSDVLVEEL
ncbi:GGDEF domain-containing protein [Rhodospirillum rubrum]|uniref:bifunctional diguanylate cyclase/phosphodiesterase n=1 Tax=Rhodospirillum rubrum TaxID=1085 RepID=UPI001904E66C|nr:bifunctional diguanylate cyclase/phosphodiesterase [Rhodospirillum rubrum]MBK1665734.1 GGDEF domain-containing protein [Rhodospirillum rubrum]MBK1677599.1 GGDEF domain-containing protein [Rhodospirillum rubrum]